MRPTNKCSSFIFVIVSCYHLLQVKSYVMMIGSGRNLVAFISPFDVYVPV